MTGCCIYNWHIEHLDMSKVHCSYVYTQFNYSEKKPTERYPQGREFEPGELGKQYQTDHSSLDLYFTEPLNWEVLVFALAQVELEEQPLQLTIQSYEVVEDNYLVKLLANQLVNSKQLTRRILQIYPIVKQKLLVRREEILSLLGIRGTKLEQSVLDGQNQITPQSSALQIDRHTQLYQEVVRQIQHILVTQYPDQIVNSVQRLLDYLSREGVSTIEIQKRVIGQAIVQRARRDRGFRDHLLQWQPVTTESVKRTAVGQAIQLAIATLKNRQSN